MGNIFRLPVDNQHYKETIQEGKPVSEIKRFLSDEVVRKLENIFKDGIVRYWGSLPSAHARVHFNNLEEGDELLCYRSGKYIALAKIAGLKIENRNLAKYSWGETETGATWELIYFFSEVNFIDIPAGIVHQGFGFADGPVMGFSRVAEDKTKKFIDNFGSVANFLRGFVRDKEIEKAVLEEISRKSISSPYEAQYYLVDLGNQLEFDTFVPSSDGGREAFGRKLDELTTIKIEDLGEYVAPRIFDPLSHIDVIWFKENYKPKFFYEVVYSTGMNEAFGRLQTVSGQYETAKTRIIGNHDKSLDFERCQRLYFPNIRNISYKLFDDLMKVYESNSNNQKIVKEFLD
jgi:hypothetical protein